MLSERRNKSSFPLSLVLTMPRIVVPTAEPREDMQNQLDPVGNVEASEDSAEVCSHC